VAQWRQACDRTILQAEVVSYSEDGPIDDWSDVRSLWNDTTPMFSEADGQGVD
jgi:hypothetical protein